MFHFKFLLAKFQVFSFVCVPLFIYLFKFYYAILGVTFFFCHSEVTLMMLLAMTNNQFKSQLKKYYYLSTEFKEGL